VEVSTSLRRYPPILDEQFYPFFLRFMAATRRRTPLWEGSVSPLPPSEYPLSFLFIFPGFLLPACRRKTPPGPAGVSGVPPIAFHSFYSFFLPQFTFPNKAGIALTCLSDLFYASHFFLVTLPFLNTFLPFLGSLWNDSARCCLITYLSPGHLS